mgnify:CR=1 FL=1
MDTKKHLENKLKSIKDQILWNGIMTIVAILFILFFPPTSFDANNFRINVHLEWIIFFILMVVGIINASILGLKKKDIEEDLNFYNGKNKLK